MEVEVEIELAKFGGYGLAFRLEASMGEGA